ncbi:MAG: hypothetical protein ABIP21_09065 [Acidimicrobiia bacterium]
MTGHHLSPQRLGSAAAVLIVGLAACGSGSSGDSQAVASLSKTSTASGSATKKSTTTSQADFRKQLLAYAACMRTNGVDFPDPQFDANGRPQFSQGSGGQNFGDLQNSPNFAAAQKACASTQPDFAGQFQRTPAQQAAQRKSLLKYAKCMRTKGIDFPDPTFDSTGRPQFSGDGGPQGQNRTDPAFQAASTACRSAVGGLGGPGGGPGGAAGGAPPAKVGSGSTGGTGTNASTN